MAGKLNLDKLDLQIIHEMMETAEISYADLGKKLFVSLLSPSGLWLQGFQRGVTLSALFVAAFVNTECHC